MARFLSMLIEHRRQDVSDQAMKNADAGTSAFFMAWSLTSCRRCSISIDKKRAISDRERCSLAGGGCVDSVPAIDNLDPCTSSSWDYCNIVETTS
ncbi:hypothetical protein pipiens_012399 [Culex pipiens pipiens]|uniref:Uncharacterized protein n=1 Tax=Culex pipiens pipiens TaxID=38569 RepID=A0ABD1D2L6_CULPP